MQRWAKKLNRHFLKEDIQIFGQLTHEKMLKIIYHYRNTNKNHEIPLHTHQTDIFKKQKTTTTDVENVEPMYTFGGNVKWYTHCGRQS